MGKPILNASLPLDEEDEMYTDPEIIYEAFKNKVDYIIDGGFGGTETSTIVDCTQSPPEIIRQGAGILM